MTKVFSKVKIRDIKDWEEKKKHIEKRMELNITLVISRLCYVALLNLTSYDAMPSGAF